MSRGNSTNTGKHNGHANGRFRSSPARTNAHYNGNGAQPVMITGGAGFIGTNLAHRLLSRHKPVLLYDNLSRPGVEQNLKWLRATHGSLVQFEHADVRNREALAKAVRDVSQVFHFAAQVAVTTSLEDPIDDFEVNARGTLNLLEALRTLPNPPSLIYTSTNKVYGHLNDVILRARADHYEPEDPAIRENGFSEQRPIHFHSPYGCSKGAAEQYVLDYARTFGLRAAVFRMSCIYGLHQFGNEDQGWVAHFLIRALNGEPITIYGDGRQVRDVLFVEDLVDAFLLAQKNINSISGQVFNLGGGPSNTTSLLELLRLISELGGKTPEVRFDAWRPADQQYYVSDTRRFQEAAGWKAKVGVREGVTRLWNWLAETRSSSRPETHAPSAPANGKTIYLSSASLQKNLRLKRTPRLKRPFQLNGETKRRTHPELAKAI